MAVLKMDEIAWRMLCPSIFLLISLCNDSITHPAVNSELVECESNRGISMLCGQFVSLIRINLVAT